MIALATQAGRTARTADASLTPSVVPLASPDEVHRCLHDAYRIGNRARLRFARMLHAAAEGRVHIELGHPSITQYAERCFGMQRSETFEMLRVAGVIDNLPACRQAIEDGALSWAGRSRGRR